MVTKDPTYKLEQFEEEIEDLHEEIFALKHERNNSCEGKLLNFIVDLYQKNKKLSNANLTNDNQAAIYKRLLDEIEVFAADNKISLQQ